MQTVTIYEATNPDGPTFTARIEGRACVGVGKTISDALHELADDLIGAKPAVSARVGGEVNFVSDFSPIPSCSTCGTVEGQNIVCTLCGSFLAEAIAATIKNNPQFVNYVANLTVETVVAPTNTGVDNPGIENGAANTYQVGGSHYKTAIEHWDYVIANDIPYLEAQVIKYLTRWRKKNGMEDVLKSKHYLDKLIEVETDKKKGSV